MNIFLTPGRLLKIDPVICSASSSFTTFPFLSKPPQKTKPASTGIFVKPEKKATRAANWTELLAIVLTFTLCGIRGVRMFSFTPSLEL
jgi:hypothetical protein